MGGRAKPVLAIAVGLATAGLIAVPSTSAAAPYYDALLTLRHPEGLASFVKSVSNPASEHYREYAKVEQLKKTYGASKKTKRKALLWLSRHGLRGKVGPTGTYVLARVPRPTAMRLIAKDAQAAGGVPAARVPRELRDSVSEITLLDQRPVVGDQAAFPDVDSDDVASAEDIGSLLPRTGTPAGCAEGQSAGDPELPGFTPNQYLTAYGHSTLQAKGLLGQRIRVSVVEIDGFRRSDIETFGQCFGLTVPPTPIHTIGIPEPLPPGDETTLDLEVLTAAAPGLKAIDVYEGGSTQAQLLSTIAASLGPKGKHPRVISISLGECEAELAGTIGPTEQIDEVFALAAGAGISTFVAAGDTGSSACRTEDKALGIVSASYPATSPYVTAVGGTNLELNAANQIVKQPTWNDSPLSFGAGGGGVSIIEPRPWWQHGARFQQHATERIVPDIAALADILPGYAIYCTNHECGPPPDWTQIGGTSAATPLMAGGMVLADQLAKRSGQPPLGLINPLLYRMGRGGKPGILSDVFIGNNDLGTIIPKAAGGGAPLGCCPALAGFDHATGWGSLVVNVFAKAARRAAP